MACVLELAKLSDARKKHIAKHLSFTPQVPYNVTSAYAASPTTIKLFHATESYIRLPYAYSVEQYKVKPNSTFAFTPVIYNFTGNLRDEQIPVEQEAWNQLTTHGTTTLALYTGFGKTIVGAALAARTKLLTLVLVHREFLTTQWHQTFTKVTSGSVWIVGEKSPPKECQIIICMDTRWQQIPEPMRAQVGCVIIDEAHVFCTPNHVPVLLAFTPKYLILETATPEREDGLHQMLIALAGKHQVHRALQTNFTVIKVQTGTVPVRQVNKIGKTDYNQLLKQVLNNERRNQLIIDFVRVYSNNTILILTKLVEHAQLLYEKISALGISCDYMYRNRNSYSNCKVLIGTMSKIGTGFDQQTACVDFDGRRLDLLLLVASIKSYIGLVQNVGRVFRASNPIILHLVDKDNIFNSHWYRARTWYLSRGAKILKYKAPEQDFATHYCANYAQLPEDIPKPTKPTSNVSARKQEEHAQAILARYKAN
jgi:superfamily II DNA or RNA helicase